MRWGDYLLFGEKMGKERSWEERQKLMVEMEEFVERRCDIG